MHVQPPLLGQSWIAQGWRELAIQLAPLGHAKCCQPAIQRLAYRAAYCLGDTLCHCQAMQSQGVVSHRQMVVMRIQRPQLCQIAQARRERAIQLAALGRDDIAQRQHEHAPVADVTLCCCAVCPADWRVRVIAIAGHKVPAIVARVCRAVPCREKPLRRHSRPSHGQHCMAIAGCRCRAIPMPIFSAQ